MSDRMWINTFNIFIVNCGSLLGLLNDDIIEVIGSDQPAIVGASATFSCPSTHILNGSNTTMCMGNGKWEPDPTLVECIGKYFKTKNSCCSSS